jgi:hypothetical protein
MIKYISYILLIFIILKCYKNNSKYTEIITALLICIGIYIINLILPNKMREHFGKKKKKKKEKCENKTDLENSCDCGNGDHINNENDKLCDSHHCILGKCSNKSKKGDPCGKNNDCNDYNGVTTKTYKTKYFCDVDGKCKKK